MQTDPAALNPAFLLGLTFLLLGIGWALGFACHAYIHQVTVRSIRDQAWRDCENHIALRNRPMPPREDFGEPVGSEPRL